jgi:rhodanese-related sulfurtransferase
MNKHNAIIAIHSNVITIRGDVAYDANENIIQYNEAAVQAYIDANAYKEQRAKAYPSFADQFDLLYHGGLDAWKAAIDAVKTQYPKA